MVFCNCLSSVVGTVGVSVLVSRSTSEVRSDGVFLVMCPRCITELLGVAWASELCSWE